MRKSSRDAAIIEATNLLEAAVDSHRESPSLEARNEVAWALHSIFLLHGLDYTALIFDTGRAFEQIHGRGLIHIIRTAKRVITLIALNLVLIDLLATLTSGQILVLDMALTIIGCILAHKYCNYRANTVARSYLHHVAAGPCLQKVRKEPWAYARWKELPKEVELFFSKVEDCSPLVTFFVEETTFWPDKPAICVLWALVPETNVHAAIAVWLDIPSGKEEKVFKPATNPG